MSDNLLTIKEAAKQLKVHWQTVRNYINSGKLKSFKIGKNIRIRESDLQKFLSNKKSDKIYEVEIRFLSKKRAKIEERLIKMGAKLIYHAHVIDHWFVPNHIKNMQQKNEYYNSGGGYGLRIREQDNGYTGKITTTLETKRLLIPNNHEVCIEGELNVENYDETKKFLNLIDMKEFIQIDKDRVIYGYKEFKIVFDDIKNFKTVIEIEIKTKNDQKKTLEKIRKFAEKIGLELKKEITNSTSATHEYMNKFSKF